jgi:hypothetical protein
MSFGHKIHSVNLLFEVVASENNRNIVRLLRCKYKKLESSIEKLKRSITLSHSTTINSLNAWKVSRDTKNELTEMLSLVQSIGMEYNNAK